MTDGVVIRVAAGVKVEAPIHLGFRYFGKESFSSTSRVMISVEEGADVLFFETHDGPPAAPYQSNTMIEIRVSDKAKVSHVRIANDRGAAVALSLMSAVVGAEAKLHTFGVSAGAQVARHQIHVDFKGKNSTALISGVAMPHGQQHSDTTLLVDHIATDCESRELFKTIVGGRATGVFQGRITVEPESQKTDARMMSASLLLSEDATMNNKPELLIFADDVVCAHGATCGQLDEELLFYLMARGLPRQAAELIMLRAFLGEAVETIEDEPLRSVANEFIESWLKVDQATRRANHVEGEYNA
jgi:Fe-S cluster assembly protein SufD